MLQSMSTSLFLFVIFRRVGDLAPINVLCYVLNLDVAAQWQQRARHTALWLASFCYYQSFLNLCPPF